MKILIADDDPIPRRLLEAALVKAGNEVVVARDGSEAWQILQTADAPRLAILDWLMPGIDGVEICRKIRQRPQGSYLYLILLTSKADKADVVAGMEAGADDYLTKPFDPHELQVRVRAGQRILDLEAALVASRDALAQARQREVEIGARIQQTLLLGRLPHDQSAAQVAALTLPSQQIDGDFYDFFSYRDDCLDILVGDVMGKGVPAALLGAAIKSHFLRALSHLIALSEARKLPEPEEIVSRVHADVTGQFIGLEFFATLCYARFDLEQHKLTFVDCGHTKTIHFHANTGTCTLLEGENMPLGISEKETYTQMAAPFEVGDLFCFYSDGVTEAHSPSGEQFGIERLMELIQTNARTAPEEMVDRIHHAIVEFTSASSFADDLTCVALQISEQGAAPAETRAEWEISSDLAQLAGLRERVRAFCAQLGPSAWDEDSIIQLELAVNEVASNIMRHAYSGRPDRRIQVVIEAAEDTISMWFHHYGKSFDPEMASPPAFDGTREGGFGVYMIAQCVDELHYAQDAHGKNTVSLLKRRRKERPAQSS